jgi:ATP/maltotriose-dependent transcriptional regulator MalT
VFAELAAIELRYHLPGCVQHTDAAMSLAPDDAGRCRLLTAVASPVFTLAIPAPAAVFGDIAEHLAGHLDAAARPDREDRRGVPAEWDQLLLTTAQALLAGRAGTTRLAARLAAMVLDRPAAQAFHAALAVASAAGGRARARVGRLAARSSAGAAPDSSSLALSALAQAWAEEFTDAERLVRYAVRTARSIPDQSLARLVQADLAYRRGDLAGGLEHALDAARSAEESGSTNLYAAAAATAARIRLERGEPDAARVLLRARPADTSHPLLWSSYALSRGMLAEADRDDAEALRWFVECGRRLTAAGLTNPACSPWRTLAATAHLCLGEVQAARAVADDEVRLAQRWGTRGALGRALSVAGAARAGRAGLALQIRAVELLTHPEHQLEYARALLRLGAAQHEGGSAQTARDTFAQALQAAIGCGAARLAEEAGARIRRRGAGPRHQPAAGSSSLTIQELRVAELVVTGLSNVEVANALLISKRTVDTHLVHMYRKLGIRNRRGLEDFLAGRERATVAGPPAVAGQEQS